MDSPFPPSPLDFDGERRKDSVQLEAAWEKAEVIAVDLNEETFTGTAGGLEYLSPDKAPEGRRVFLGTGNKPVFAVFTSLSDGVRLRSSRTHWSDVDVAVAMEALAVGQWHERHRFHPRTGLPLSADEGGWVLRDTEGNSHFPQISPAVITLIHDGADRVLLVKHAHGALNRKRRFALVAGFVDPGESAEDAVIREIGEEVGLEAWNLKYLGSQPWPFPASLMFAYTAQADPEACLQLQDSEIAQAQWFSRAEVDEIFNAADGWWGQGFMRSSTALRIVNHWLGNETSYR
ncbi:NAD(+) diphosphatase [Haloglycomyces albus]|uniref:NAD(+) diphosphatase n=1 Tax=Haloglycomyces albus TaxID=526067 RepID=UPI00046D0AEF|nr:NAD(+) diphosphatase [Haloglycomyces albus]